MTDAAPKTLPNGPSAAVRSFDGERRLLTPEVDGAVSARGQGAPVAVETVAVETVPVATIPGGLVEWGGTAQPVTRSPRRRPGRWGRRLRRCLVPLVLLAVWQVMFSLGWIHSRILPSPWQVLDTFWQLSSKGTLPKDLVISVRRAAEGVALGVSFGLALGVIAGLWRLGEELLDSSMHMVRTVPFIALWPLLIVWFGVGETPKILLIALSTVTPMYINVYAGIRNVDQKLVESARVVGLGTGGLIREVVVPGALPQVLVGLRLSLSVSIIALVAAEQINATSGIGYLMQNAEQFVQMNIIVVGLVVYALIGLGVVLVRVLERVLLRWRHTFSGS